MSVIRETPTALLQFKNGILQQQWFLYCRRNPDDKASEYYSELVWRTVPDTANSFRSEGKVDG